MFVAYICPLWFDAASKESMSFVVLAMLSNAVFCFGTIPSCTGGMPSASNVQIDRAHYCELPLWVASSSCDKTLLMLHKRRA